MINIIQRKAAAGAVNLTSDFDDIAINGMKNLSATLKALIFGFHEDKTSGTAVLQGLRVSIDSNANKISVSSGVAVTKVGVYPFFVNATVVKELTSEEMSGIGDNGKYLVLRPEVKTLDTQEKRLVKTPDGTYEEQAVYSGQALQYTIELVDTPQDDDLTFGKVDSTLKYTEDSAYPILRLSRTLDGVTKILDTATNKANKDSLMLRDENGRAKIASPSTNDDIANKQYVDDCIDIHEARQDNPHEVTKAQVGLGNCDNTADKDKHVKSASMLSSNGSDKSNVGNFLKPIFFKDGKPKECKNSLTYTTLNELVLTSSATIDDVRNKLQVGESCCIRTDAFNDLTQFNNIQYGYLKITQTVNGLCEIWLNDVTSDDRLYYGIQASGKFSKWQKVQTRQTYISLAQMGLTANATIDNVIDALKEGETALISTNEFTNYKEGMFPNQCTNDQYAVIKVEKESGSKVFLEWRQKGGNAYAIGGLDSSNKFTNWDNLVRFKKDGFADDSIVCIGDTVSSDGVIQTLATLGFPNDIMTWNTGVYRVSHVSELTNLPSNLPSASPSFRLEHHDCKKWGSNHSPASSTYGVRHSVLYVEGGKIYHRYTESGTTAGTFTKDTGWQQISCGQYYSVYHLNLVKGKSIELVANTDNTLKLVEALDAGEEFVDWFSNSNDRFGLGAEAGSRIDYLRIQKTTADNGIILAITDYGKTFTRSYSNSTLRDWCWDKSKATAFFNSKTFKIDITKGNENWNGNMKFGYCVDESYGEINISSLGKTEVTWDHSTGVRYVKSVTYTIDPNNKAHVTIGVELYDTVYGIHQLKTSGDFATINSFTGDAFTGTSVAKRGATRGRNNGVGILCEVADLGLTTPCTTVQIAQAMRGLVNSMNRIPQSGMIGIFDNGGSKITDAPSEYGLLQVSAYGYDRVMIRYDGIASSSYTGSWIGQIKGSGGTFSGITWKRIISGDLDAAVTEASGQILGYSASGTAQWTDRYGKAFICTETAETAAKTLVATNFKLEAGVKITVMFQSGNQVANPTLNVNSSGAKEIVCQDYSGIKRLTLRDGASAYGAYRWDSKTILDLYYNGTYWVVIGNPIVWTSNRSCTSCVHINGLKRIKSYVSMTNNTETFNMDFTFENATSYYIYANVVDTTVGNCPVSFLPKNRTSTGFQYEAGYANNSGAHSYQGKFLVFVEGM